MLKNVDYSLANLHNWCLEALKHPCPYCKGTFTIRQLSVDHCHPASRKGRHVSHNLCFCCQECNQAKGPLTAEEFMQLVAVVSLFEPVARNNVIRRLRAGGKLIRSR